MLEVVPEIEEIAAAYIRQRLMPQGDMEDAYHLAVASYYATDFLLTWNCAHLANANKQEHIRHVNALLGLHVPILTTPLELIETPEDER